MDLRVVERGIDRTEHSPSSGADELYLDFVSFFSLCFSFSPWLRKGESHTIFFFSFFFLFFFFFFLIGKALLECGQIWWPPGM
jgi:hypothetical protein